MVVRWFNLKTWKFMIFVCPAVFPHLPLPNSTKMEPPERFLPRLKKDNATHMFVLFSNSYPNMSIETCVSG